MLLWLILPALLIIAVFWFFIGKKRRGSRRAVGAAVIEALTAVVIVLLAAGLSVEKDTERQSVVILMDVSDSTAEERAEMEAACKRLTEGLDARDLCGVAAFGQNSVWFSGSGFTGDSLRLDRVETDGTDLGAALRFALTKMEPYTHHRVILLSDGRETSGDALTAAGRLTGEGGRVDCMYFDTPPKGPDIQLTSVTTTGGACVGDTVRVSVRIDSTAACDAVLTLSDRDEVLSETNMTLDAGPNEAVLSWTADAPGLHVLRAAVRENALTPALADANDTEPRNNVGYASYRTAGEARVLLVADDPAEAGTLRAVLAEIGDVTVVSAQDAPASLYELCRYDGIWLLNVRASVLPEGFGEALDTVVSDYGKNVTFVGGDHTFRMGDMEGTDYEELNPLLFGADDHCGTALVIIIDASASMVKTTNWLELAKTGAIRIIDGLLPTDSVGVISFASGADVLVPLTRATDANKRTASAVVSGLTNRTGTSYVPPLERAEELLKKSDAGQKHVIFLSDGQPRETQEIILQNVYWLSVQGVTVSTIGMNAAEAELSVLQAMAERGGGTFSYVKNAADLPEVMFAAADSVTTKYAFDEPLTPVIAKEGGLTDGLSALPTLSGYVGMRPKPDTDVWLATEEGRPLYAVTSVGSGTAACFTSDLTGLWSDAWLASDAGRTFVRRMVTETLSDVRYDSTLRPSCTVKGHSVTLSVSLPASEKEYDVVAEITGADTRRVRLERVTDTDYTAVVTLPKVGSYEVTFRQTDRNKTLDTASDVFAVSGMAEYDRFGKAGRPLLAEVSATSGGVLTDDVGLLCEADMGTLTARVPLDLYLCILAALLMLGEIVWRKFIKE